MVEVSLTPKHRASLRYTDDKQDGGWFYPAAAICVVGGPRNRPPKRAVSAEQAVETAVAAAVRDGQIDLVLDGSVVAALRVVACGLDRVNPAADAYGAVRLAKELRAAAECLRLTPASRRSGGGDWTAELMAMMADPDDAPSGV